MGDRPSLTGDRPSLTGDKPSLFSQNKVCPQLNVPQLKKQGLSPFLFLFF